MGAGLVALIGCECSPVVGHLRCQARDVGIVGFIVAANGIDPDECAGGRQGAVAVFDDVDLGVGREVMDRVAAEDDVRGIIWGAMKEISKVAGDNFGAAGPNGDVGLCESRGIGDIDAVVARHICIGEGVRCEPGVAATEIDDAERIGLFLCPRGERGYDLDVVHVAGVDDGLVHCPGVESFFHA